MKLVQEIDRSTYIGGSDIAGVIGMSPWATPVDIFYRKTRPQEKPTEQKKKLFKRGHRWESVVAEMLVEELQHVGHKVEIVNSNARYLDDDKPFASEIDFELRLDDETEITNCELKTVHPFAEKEWGESEDDTPTHYTAQVQWGLGVTGRKRAIIAPLFGADHIRAYTVERDDEVINWLRDSAYNFWVSHVIPGIPPDPISIEDCLSLYPNSLDSAVDASPEMVSLWLKLLELREEIKQREQSIEEIEFAFKSALKDKDTIYSAAHGQPLITWKSGTRNALDQSALKEQMPDVHAMFIKETPTRTFLVKNLKKPKKGKK